MDNAVAIVQAYPREHWHVLHHAQFKHPALGFLVTMEKALQKETRP